MLRVATALLIICGASASLQAQVTAPAPAAGQPQKAQVVKKRVCTVEQADDIGSRISTRKVCRMVEEKASETVSREQQPGTAAKPNAD